MIICDAFDNSWLIKKKHTLTALIDIFDEIILTRLESPKKIQLVIYGLL